MYKIIGGDGKEYGPVSVDELKRWIAEGRLNAQSMILAEGASEWKPLSSFPEFAANLGQKATAPPPLAGAPVHPSVLEAYTAEILTRQHRVQIGSCLSRSWQLLTANFGLLFGATAVVWGLSLVSQFIPFAPLLLHGVLYGGLSLVFLRRIRGQRAEVGDAFDGFKLAFLQLLLVGLVGSLLSGLAMCCLILPGVYLMVAWAFSVPLVADKRLEFWAGLELSRKVVTQVWFEIFILLLVVFLPFILISLVIGIKTSTQAFAAVQDVMSAGSPDPKRVMELVMQMSKSSLALKLVTNFVLLLNLPWAMGALLVRL